MFNAKVYKVMVGSLSGTMEEVYAAKETIRKWNLENAERVGRVYLPVEWSTNAEDIKLVDVLIGVIGNRVENVGMVEDCIKSGKKVMLFFSSYYDPKNSIFSEIQEVEVFRNRIKGLCSCIEYNGVQVFEKILEEQL